MNQKIKAGIIGAAGYTGGELIRLLLHHPLVEISFAHSRSHHGALVSSVHTDLLGDTELVFSNDLDKATDVIFLCLAHGESKKIMASLNIGTDTKIIDLSQDFRIGDANNNPFIYGLPELNHAAIKKASRIANPGCFATAIQLALLPLAHQQLLPDGIHISATTGTTGAGRSLNETSHFSWRSNNLSVYKAFTHQHLAEINQSLLQLQAGFQPHIQLIPQRGSFARGIMTSLILTCPLQDDAVKNIYEHYYTSHPFVHISQKNIDLKQVVNTNKCILYLEKHQDQLMVISVIDNLLKGASGQAVQNMNLAFGIEETTGLRLKASAF